MAKKELKAIEEEEKNNPMKVVGSTSESRMKNEQVMTLGLQHTSDKLN